MKVIGQGLLVVFLTGCGIESKQEPVAQVRAEREKIVDILQRSVDREELARAALELCRPEDVHGIETVIGFLCNTDFLERLDTKDNRGGLRLRIILDAIAKLPSQKASEALVRLTRNKEFMENRSRVLTLMSTSAAIKNPSSNLLEFLDNEWTPKKFPLEGILTSMGSPEAIKLIEKRFYSPDYSVRDKIGWFKFSLIRSRDEPVILDFYKNVLGKEIADSDLRNWILLTLFDYQPQKWYGDPSSLWPKVPPRREASTEVLKELLVVADLSLKLELKEETRQAARNAQKEIKEILEFRRASGPQRIEKLIIDLASDDFKVRDQATRDLEKYGDWAESYMREALKTETRLEPRQRLEELIHRIHRKPLIVEVKGRFVKIEESSVIIRPLNVEGKDFEAPKAFELAKEIKIKEMKWVSSRWEPIKAVSGQWSNVIKNLDKQEGVYVYLSLVHGRVTQIDIYHLDKKKGKD